MSAIVEQQPEPNLNATHTPGPWLIGDQSFCGTTCDIVSEDGNIIAAVGCAADYSDACLISAAPDMLEALRYVRDMVERGAPFGMHAVSAAIYKAEGRE